MVLKLLRHLAVIVCLECRFISAFPTYDFHIPKYCRSKSCLGGIFKLRWPKTKIRIYKLWQRRNAASREKDMDAHRALIGHTLKKLGVLFKGPQPQRRKTYNNRGGVNREHTVATERDVSLTDTGQCAKRC